MGAAIVFFPPPERTLFEAEVEYETSVIHMFPEPDGLVGPWIETLPDTHAGNARQDHRQSEADSVSPLTPKKFLEISVIPGDLVRLTSMTIHRLMTVIASEQVQLRRDDRSDKTAATAASVVPTDDRSDAAAEQ
ncbi:hypothetical protein [Kribbella sp. CA-293567]|uniref:hypothetical protein n=1 Tax=Kribbella sp. CA-293567 TaxID=3002436 RepID=UPI0022DE933A|nr:hypothetical protein [Kribbella sp. CA-293567]WBQ08738.1 hypothetical protein OX958_32440 [Kribbella sp. CA-293567]